jgi:hypothetical protein
MGNIYAMQISQYGHKKQLLESHLTVMQGRYPRSPHLREMHDGEAYAYQPPGSNGANLSLLVPFRSGFVPVTVMWTLAKQSYTSRNRQPHFITRRTQPSGPWIY